MKFATGGLVREYNNADDLIPVRLSPGTILMKRSVYEKDGLKSIPPFMNVHDNIKIIDDELWDKLSPSERNKL